MAPMVDIVFLLLVFFIFTYQVRILEEHYWVGIPPSRSNETTEDKPLELVLEATDNGELAAITSESQKWTTLDEFVEQMQGKLQQASSGQPILVQPDDLLKYQHVVAVCMVVQQNGCELSLLRSRGKGSP